MQSSSNLQRKIQQLYRPLNTHQKLVIAGTSVNTKINRSSAFQQLSPTCRVELDPRNSIDRCLNFQCVNSDFSLLATILEKPYTPL